MFTHSVQKSGTSPRVRDIVAAAAVAAVAAAAAAASPLPLPPPAVACAYNKHHVHPARSWQLLVLP